MIRNAHFSTFGQPKKIKLWSRRKVCDALHYLLDSMFISFGSDCKDKLWVFLWVLAVLLVTDFVLSLSDSYQAEVVEAFNSAKGSLGGLLDISSPCFAQMVARVRPAGRRLSGAVLWILRPLCGFDDALAAWPTGVYQLNFVCSCIQFYSLLSPYLCFIPFLYLDLYVLGDDALIS